MCKQITRKFDAFTLHFIEWNELDHMIVRCYIFIYLSLKSPKSSNFLNALGFDLLLHCHLKKDMHFVKLSISDYFETITISKYLKSTYIMQLFSISSVSQVVMVRSLINYYDLFYMTRMVSLSEMRLQVETSADDSVQVYVPHIRSVRAISQDISSGMVPVKLLLSIFKGNK